MPGVNMELASGLNTMMVSILSFYLKLGVETHRP